MTTARYLAQAIEGLADDVEATHPYQAHALRGIAADVRRLNARDLIGAFQPRDDTSYGSWEATVQWH